MFQCFSFFDNEGDFVYHEAKYCYLTSQYILLVLKIEIVVPKNLFSTLFYLITFFFREKQIFFNHLKSSYLVKFSKSILKIFGPM